MRGIHRGGGSLGAPECECRTQKKMNVCSLIKANRGSSRSLWAYHSQPNELFVPHVQNTQRLGRHLCLFSAQLSQFVRKPPYNIIDYKYFTDGEAETLKRSRDRCLLAALMGFQHRKRMFIQSVEWPCRGAPEWALLVKPCIFLSYHRWRSAKVERIRFSELTPVNSHQDLSAALCNQVKERKTDQWFP